MSERRSLNVFLSAWIPSGVVRRIRLRRLRRVFSGNYATWAEARRASAGYEDRGVLKKVVAASREVLAGRARWDRDGMAFTHPEVNAPLLAALQAIAAGEGNRLELIDFGGALGSTWRQHRAALSGLATVRWRIVEQAHYVEAGREFADDVVSFHASLAEALAAGPASTVLFSSVLPYLEVPGVPLAEAVARGMRHIVVDRTSFALAGWERIVVQRPPAKLGGAYPCWLFNSERLLAPFAPGYRLRSEWIALDEYPGVSFRGFHFERYR